jgi:hypothetical protein
MINNEQQIINTNMINWYMHIIHNINESQVSLLNWLKCDRPGIAQS